MIRRGFWLLAGAALGVTGYRRATRLARALTGQSMLGAPAVTKQRSAVRLTAAPRADQAGRAEPGMARPRQPAPASAGPTPSARIAAAAARASAAAGFVRDVRDGMAEYWDLHRSEADPTLGSQRDHIWSGGDSQQGARER
jgi:hypothetical protein